MFIETKVPNNFEAPEERNTWLCGEAHCAPPELKKLFPVGSSYKYFAALRRGQHLS
jgi:hypothetical protein